jgi:hypothetical protein
MTTYRITDCPTTELPIPIRDDVEVGHMISCGFRANMFELKDEDGNGGSMATGSGFGNDFISMDWKDGDIERNAVVRGVDLMIAWVESFDPEAAAKIRESVGS